MISTIVSFEDPGGLLALPVSEAIFAMRKVCAGRAEPSILA